MLLTKMTRGDLHRRGCSRASGCNVSPEAGLLVSCVPSRLYLARPIAFNRFVRVRA